MEKVNQQLIADHLNLSRTTVSRCFTHNPRINPETRAKVFALAAELGYQYRAPRTEIRARGQGNRIAVLFGAPKKWIIAEATLEPILGGISAQVAAEGLSLETHLVDPVSFNPGSRSRRILPGIKSTHWKGLVTVYPFAEEAIRFLKRKFPLISLLEEYDDDDVDCIDTNHGRGISSIVDHLHALGHRKIGFLTWDYPMPARWAERRFAAYAESIFRLNLDFDSEAVLNVRRNESIPEEEIAERVIQQMKKGVRAWVAAADHQAMSLIRDLQRRGIRVPEDVSVSGYDGAKVPEGIPKLTSIQMPFREIGRTAIQTLCQRMKSPTTQQRHVYVSGQLIIGESTAPPGVSDLPAFQTHAQEGPAEPRLAR